MIDADRKIRFERVFNLGHVFTVISFIGVGVAMYVGVATQLARQDQRIAALEEDVHTFNRALESIPLLTRAVELSEQRVTQLEGLASESRSTDKAMIEQLTAIREQLARVQAKLEGGK